MSKLKNIKNQPKKAIIDPKKIVDPEYLKLTTKQEKAYYFLNSAEQKLIQQLDSQKFHISKKKVPYLNQTQLQQRQRAKQQELLKKLNKQKQEARIKLSLISEREKQQRSKIAKDKYKTFLENSHKNIINKSRRNLNPNITIEGSEGSSNRPNSQINGNQNSKALLKKWVHEQRQFQKRMKQRTQQYEQKMKKLEQQEKQLEQKRKKQKNQAKRQALIKKIQELDEKRKQKTKLHEQQKKKLIQIKAKKKLHEDMERQWKQRVLKQQQMKRQQLQQRKRNKSIEFDDLREHSKKYQQLIQQQKAKRAQKAVQISRFNNSTIQHEKSKYYTSMIKQERKIRKQKQQKQKQPIIKKQKIEQYATKVRNQYAPRLKSEQDESQNKSRNFSQKKVPRLTFQQVKEMGNHFFEKSKAAMSKKDKSQQKSNIQLHEVTPARKYIDYLQETRTQKKEKQQQIGASQKSNKSQDIYQRQIKQARNIMLKQGSQKEKLDKVKLLAQKIEQDSKDKKSKMKDSNALIRKIAAKIQILEVIN